MTKFRAVLLAGAAALAPPAAAQPSEANHFVETPSGWVHPKTPWGEPDIRATLNMMQAAGVPLERCASSYRFGAAPCDMQKKWLADEEYAAQLEAWRTRVDPSRQAAAEGNFGRALLAGGTDPNMPQRQTSLIVDPPNGLLPAVTAEGKRRALSMRSSWALPGEDPAYETPLDIDYWENCRSRGMPSSMMPYRYNGGFRIHQAPGVVVLDLEMIHDARIVPTDGRPPLSGAHRHYLGESRGRWEGNTLVIETTNYKEGPPMLNVAVVGAPPGNRLPVSSQMKTTERITRLNDETWLYEITTDDPVILERPFTVRYPLRHDPGYEWWEYACHEGNLLVPNLLSMYRATRENPPPEPPLTATAAPAALARQLEGRWTGRPRIVTTDLELELEFAASADGTVLGRLIGTNLGRIDKPLRNFTIAERRLDFELPNSQPWTFTGELAADGSALVGVLSSLQGGLPITFTKGDARR